MHLDSRTVAMEVGIRLGVCRITVAHVQQVRPHRGYTMALVNRDICYTT